MDNLQRVQNPGLGTTPGLHGSQAAPANTSTPTGATGAQPDSSTTAPASHSATSPNNASQAHTNAVSAGSGSPPPSGASSPPPTVDTIFREYLYRNCRDSLFWVEVERYRMNPIPQKATFILRTFFTEGGEFYLTREDFPSQFDPLFSKQRPAAPGPMLLEAQEHLKQKMYHALGPSFAASPLMAKWSTDSSALLKELHSSSASGGVLASFLAPRPGSTILAAPVATSPSSSATVGAASAPNAVATPATNVSSPLAPTLAPGGATASEHRATSPLGRPRTGETSPVPRSTASPATANASTSAATTNAANAPGATPFTPLVWPKTAPENANGPVLSPRPFVTAVPTESALSSASNTSTTAYTSPTRATSPPGAATSAGNTNSASASSASSAQSSFPPATQSQNSSNILSSANTGAATPQTNQNQSSNFGPYSPSGGFLAQAQSAPTLAYSTPSNNPGIALPQGQQNMNSSSQNSSASSSTNNASSSAVTQSSGATNASAGQTSPPLPHSMSTSAISTQGQQAPSTPRSRAKMAAAALHERRASRGSLVDETITSSRVNKTLTGSSPAPLKPTGAPARVNVIQLVGVVRDKVGLAKKDKERKDREKYFDPVTNGWMFMEAPTLDDLIYDANMMIIFYEFLKSIHAEENLIAWVEIELYKGSSSGRETRRNMGVDLLVRYFEPSSKTLINIEGVNYKEILKELNERPARDLFDVAQRVLWDQLAFQCYLRFKDSENVRRLFEEPTLKGKKKELLKLAQKAVKASSDNFNFMAKLDELSRWRAGSVAFIPNVSEREFQLEDILYSSDLLVAFREYLNTLPNANEYLDALTFWFEVEVWRNMVPKEQLKETALQLLKDFILPRIPVNTAAPRIVMPGFDTKPLEQEVQERPDKNTFTRLQVWVWRRLKLEQFALFEQSETLTKFLDGNLPMRQNLPIVRHCENLNDLRAKIANDAQFKANSAKVLTKIRHKKQEVQGTNFEFEVLLGDREYVSILCEFLDKRQARENLTFWTEAEYYKHMDSPIEKAGVAGKIWERFFADKADTHINVDVNEKSAIQQALKEPHNLPGDLFNNCQDTIATLITYDLIPKFSVSEQGQRLIKTVKRRPPNQAAPSFRAGGLQAIKDLRSWLGVTDEQ